MIIVAVPELEQLLAGQTALPARLAALLARAQTRPLQGPGWASELVVGQPVPVAPLTRLLDAPADCSGIWLRADPVRLTPDLNAVWMTPGASLDLDHGLVTELQDVVADAGLVFDLPHPERGYLKLESVPECRFVSPDEVLGESLDYVLPAGPGAKFWRQLLNDCQIVAHQYFRKIDTAGPGGLWFWGAGSLPAVSGLPARVQDLFGEDAPLVSLARWLGLGHAAVSPAPKDLPASCLVEWKSDAGVDRTTNLLALDAWLRPLWRRLRTGRLDALEIAGRKQVWRVMPYSAWRFWRRSPSGLS